MLIHDGHIEPEVLARYRAEGAMPLRCPQEFEGGIRILRKNLIAEGTKLRHDSEATCDGILQLWSESLPGRDLSARAVSRS